MFKPAVLGNVELKNRIVMAPMTRSRAIGGVPGALHVEYYGQRTSAGLIITEGTASSASGLGYARTPGIFTEQQVEGWRAVTNAVHSRGGRIFLQLMHVGRIAHPLNQPEGAKILAPSPIAAKGSMWTDQSGMQPFPVPGELTAEGIREVIREYGAATANARRAGFDGVELHSANGYLPNQFLSPNTNQRTDDYGGSVERRARFVLEVFDAMSAEWSSSNVGVRVSPGGTFNDILDSAPRATYTYVAQQLSARGAAYLHVIRPNRFAPAEAAFDVWSVLRSHFHGTFIAADSLTAEEASQLIESGAADLVAFGRPFISNPDLPVRFENKWPLAQPDLGSFYTPGEKGYTDYPSYMPAANLVSA